MAQLELVLAPALVVLLGALAVFSVVSEPAGRWLRVGGGRRTDRPGGQPDEPSAGPEADELRPAALDRVLRVGTWVFLFTVATIVASTGLWQDRHDLILALLVIVTVAVFVIHELLPGVTVDTPVLVVEGILGLAFSALLVALTGGAMSPFTPVFAMVVAGASVVVAPRVILPVTGAATAAYLAAVAIGGPTPLTSAALAIVGVNLAVLCLVGFVGTAFGREHRRARGEAIRRATEDDLTGLRTRRSLFTALEREVLRSQRSARAFCLLMIDLDDLKGINDRQGHLAGDAALRAVGEVINAGIRRIDTGVRFGGDEFVVLLPETDPTGGWVLAEKLRRDIADAGVVVDGAPVRTTASVGVVSCPHDGVTVGEILERADEAMYRSKRAGRNRVSTAESEGPPQTPAQAPPQAPAPRPAPAGSAWSGGSDEPV